MSDRLRAKRGEGEFANPRLTSWPIFSRPSRGCASTTEIAKRRMARTLWVCDLGTSWDLLRPRRADLKRSAPACGSLLGLALSYVRYFPYFK
jgi:hypothetical protein